MEPTEEITVAPGIFLESSKMRFQRGKRDARIRDDLIEISHYIGLGHLRETDEIGFHKRLGVDMRQTARVPWRIFFGVCQQAAKTALAFWADSLRRPHGARKKCRYPLG